MSEVFDKATEKAMGSVKIPLGGRGIPSAMGSGTKEGLASLGERLYSEYEKLPWYKQLLLDVAPGTGETISAYEAPIFAKKTKEAYEEEDYLATAGYGTLTGLSALGAVPFLGAGIRGVKAGVKGVGKGLSDIMSRPANINVPTEQTKFTASRIFDPKQPSERGDQIQIELLQNDKPPLLQSTANKLYDDGYQLKTRSSPALDENAMPIKGTFESDIWLGKDDKTDSIGLFSKFSEKDGEPFVEIFFREATGGASDPVSLKKYELRLAKERAAGHEAGSTAARRRGTTRKFFGDLNNPEDLDNLVDDAVRLNQKFIKENQEVSKIFQKYRNMNEAVAKKRIKKLTEELKEEQKKLNTRLDKELKGEKQDTWNVDRSRGLSGLGESFTSPLQVGVDESLMSGKFLKNYTEKDFDILENLVSKGKATAGTTRANKILNAPIENGESVGIRLNLNSRIEDVPENIKPMLQTIHKNSASGKALSYKPFATVVAKDNKKVKFYVSPKGREDIATGKKAKYPAMSVNGAYDPDLKILPSDPDVIEIGFNPKAHHLFIDLKSGQAVKEADAATVIGDRVYAKGVTYFKKSEAPTPKAESQVRYKYKKRGGSINE